MQDYMKAELDKVIKDQIEKIRSKIQSLHLKTIQRERIEAEIVELKGEIQLSEDFVRLMERLITDEEDRLIEQGLKLLRSEKRGRKTHDQSESA